MMKKVLLIALCIAALALTGCGYNCKHTGNGCAHADRADCTD